jgi:hypothetical protein
MLHYAQLANLARGEELLSGLRSDTETVHARLVTVDVQFVRAYTGALATQEELATDSAAGRDPSRIAKCGPLCVGALQMTRRLKAEFAPLGTPVVAVVWPVTDAQVGYTRVLQDIDALRPKGVLLARMCATLDRSCENPLAAVTEDGAYRRLTAAFGTSEKAGRMVVVLRQVDADVRAALRGEVTVLVGLLFGVVLLLPSCELILVLFLRLALTPRPAGAAIAHLRLVDSLLDEEMALETRIATKRAFRGAVTEALA